MPRGLELDLGLGLGLGLSTTPYTSTTRARGHNGAAAGHCALVVMRVRVNDSINSKGEVKPGSRGRKSVHVACLTCSM